MPEEISLKKAYELLAEDEFEEASRTFSSLIQNDPTLCDAYIGRLLAELSFPSESALKASSADISENGDFIKALELAGDDRKRELEELMHAVEENRQNLSLYDHDFLENIYTRATSTVQSSESYRKNASVLRSIGGYRDASILAEKYEKIADELLVKEKEEERLRALSEAEAREKKRKKSDSVQIKIYSIACIILSLFIVFLICYNTFLADFFKKQEVLDLVHPLTYDDLVVMTEKEAPWFSVTDEGELDFDKEKYSGDGNVVIPDVFENTLVRSLGDSAFKNCSEIKSVVISSYVEKIGEHAFDSCTSLESAVLPAKLEKIPAFLFYNCTSLSNVTLPESLESIDQYAFANCDAIDEIILPEALAYIGSYAFGNCNSLESITVPKTLSYIGLHCFAECGKLSFVIYTGDTEEFKDIKVMKGNDRFTEAEVSYK